MEERAPAINILALAPGCLAVCGLLEKDPRHRSYLVPTSDPVAVAEAFKIGAGANRGVPDHQECLGELRRVQARNPFLPFFADTHGFKFCFGRDMTIDLVRFYRRLCPEALRACSRSKVLWLVRF
jgi:hypothetical protein